MHLEPAPGITWMDLVKPGLLVQNRSSTLSARVGSFCCCYKLKVVRTSKTFKHKLHCLAPMGTDSVIQSISPALKSPPRARLGFFSAFSVLKKNALYKFTGIIINNGCTGIILSQLGDLLKRLFQFRQLCW